MARKDIELAIRIAGEIDKSLGYSVDMTEKELNRLARDAAIAQRTVAANTESYEKWSGGVDKATRSFIAAGKTVIGIGAAGAAAVAGIGAAALKAGTDFEDAFTGVKKTVEATDEELDVIEDKLRDMAKNKPKTVVEIAGTAEIAGQSGVEVEAIPEFSGVMIDLASATDLEEATGAEQLAQYANITRMANDEFDEFGATLVDLGNKLPATESKIMEMATKIAATGSQLRMSDAEILGWSGALASVGLEPQGGGTGFSRTAIEIQSAVENQSEALTDFARVSGLTREEFTSLFNEDASKALYQFVSGLNNVERNGKSALGVLADLDINEIRQRDTLLRLANASEMVGTSLDNADTAWEDNIALAKEADQRYRTFNSRLQMTKNRVNDVGISLYQDFQEPLSDLMGVALDASEDLDIFDDEWMEDMAKASRERIPTAIRKCKELGNTIGDFAGPIAEAAIDNLDLIKAGIVGIGSALLVANIAKGVGDLVQLGGRLKTFSLNLPNGLIGNAGFLGGISSWGTVASIVIGLITAGTSAYKAWRKEVVNGKLDEVFGDITLSMDELNDMADQIVTGGKITEMERQLEELEKLDDLSRGISNSADEIDKAIWKVLSGFELGEPEKESFQSNVTSMINDALSAVQQSQYTAELGVNLIFGTDNENSDLFKENIDQFYGGAYDELSELGTDLAELVNSAFENNILDEDEARAIADKVAELRRTVAEMTQDQEEATMNRLVRETGQNLTAESFRNLLDTGAESLSTALEANQKAADQQQGRLNRQLENGQISQQDYDELSSTLREQENRNRLEYYSNLLNYSSQTLYPAFDLEDFSISDEQIASYVEHIREQLESGQFSVGSISSDFVQSFLGMDEIDSVTKEALSGYWEELEPVYQDLRREIDGILKSGGTIDEDTWREFYKTAVLGAISGSEEALWDIIGGEFAEDSELSAVLQLVCEYLGEDIPEWVADGIESNSDTATEAVGSLWNKVERETERQSRKGIDAYLKVTWHTSSDWAVKEDPLGLSQIERDLERNHSGKSFSIGSAGTAKLNVAKHAEGGILTEPHIGLVAEDGPEAVIPLDGSKRAKSLWQLAGEILGLTGSKSHNVAVGGNGSSSDPWGQSYVIQYQPTYQLYGTASADDLRAANEEDYRRFQSFMARFVKDQRRLAF